jgi:hypothetical protein
MFGQFLCHAEQKKGAKANPHVAQAKALVGRLVKEDYVGATKNFNAEVKQSLSIEKLQTVWKAILTQAGAYKKQLDVQSSRVKQGTEVFDVVIVKCQFERANLNVRVVFDSTDRVAGLFFAEAK